MSADRSSHRPPRMPGRGRGFFNGEAPQVRMLRARTLEGLVNVLHGFTGRTFDPDDPDSGILHLARSGGADDATLTRRWEAVARSLHPKLDATCTVLLEQVHGAEVLRIQRPTGPLAVAGRADAAYTDVPGIVLAVRTADCVPVLVAGRRFVGVAHSGWRGTAAGVVPALVEALRAEGEAVQDLVVAIGPAVSGEAYEVGAEVVDGLLSTGLGEEDFLLPGRERPHIDLGAAIRAQLRRLDVHRVETLPFCTVNDGRFHSHRRDGAASGRQAAVIARCP